VLSIPDSDVGSVATIFTIRGFSLSMSVLIITDGASDDRSYDRFCNLPTAKDYITEDIFSQTSKVVYVYVFLRFYSTPLLA
jgi:hypothetical protein